MAEEGQCTTSYEVDLSAADPVGLAARAALRVHLDALIERSAEAVGGGVEPVHQLRVACRRLRAALKLFAKTMPGLPAKAVERDLKWLGKAIGRVRNSDVLLADLQKCGRKLDKEMRRALRPLELAIREERTRDFLKLLAVLRSARLESIRTRIEAELVTPEVKPEPLGIVAADLLAPMVRSMMRAGNKITKDSPPDDLHKFRVRAKRLRYAMETIDDLGGKAQRKLIGRLEDVQDVFGELHDTHEHLVALKSRSNSSALQPAAMMAIGALIYSLERRTIKLRGRCLKEWQRLGHSGLLRSALEELRHCEVPPPNKSSIQAEVS